MMRSFFQFVLISIFSFIPALNFGQSLSVEKDLSYHLKIPGITQISSTEIHAYLLSKTDGLIVFRTHPDSLQWLFTVEDVNERGNQLRSDVRFAYLFGGSTQLHIIEPTSLLGIYSVADLGFEVSDIARINESLYVSGVDGEFGWLNLSTPDTVVTSFKRWDHSLTSKFKVKQVESYKNSLIILSDSDSLFILNKTENDFQLQKKFAAPSQTNRLFMRNAQLFASTSFGQIYQIDVQNATSKSLGNVEVSVSELGFWNDLLIIRTQTGIIYLLKDHTLNPIITNAQAGNRFIISKNSVWISDYDDVYRLKLSSTPNNVAQPKPSETWKLEPIQDYIIPYPKPLLVHFETNPAQNASNLLYTVKSAFENVTKLNQNNLYWQPSARDIGVHIFQVIATDTNGNIDSTHFKVDIRAFNLPPKFTPFRPLSIPVSHLYSYQFSAIDPDGLEKNLVRYVGIDMPDGASLDEKSGVFNWTPTLQQVGKNNFRVIATDQYGTASSLDVSITVLDIKQQ